MGRIIMPPNPIYYTPPKAVGGEVLVGTIIGRAMVLEPIEGQGDYYRIIDRVKWDDENSENSENIRFTYFYRKPNGTDTDWVYGQGAGHMTIETLIKLLKKAKTNPDFGTFENKLDKISLG
ncbi:MAG: hypothetical protein V1847_01705 [Candidatus Diapherotrites archaeon]